MWWKDEDQVSGNQLITCNWQTWDAFDFFTVSLTVTSLSKTFDKSKTDITWGITLVLMLRSVGSIIFGIAADRYGRKWPFIVNNFLFIVLELVRQDVNWGFARSPIPPAMPSVWRAGTLPILRLGDGYPSWRLRERRQRCTGHLKMPQLTNEWQGTGFCQTYEQFLACRALFGIAMGGLYGNAAATALEDLPEEARGLMSGILQQGVSGL
jgi:MFS family permease